MKVPNNKILETIFMTHYQEWCWLAYGYLQDTQEAEDVVQDVFVKLLQRGRTEEIQNLTGYVYNAVKNTSLTKLKQSKKRKSLLWCTNAVPSCEADIITEETRTEIQKNIEALPVEGKRVFKLCVLEGLKQQNAAEILGISINTVKYHLKKSFKVLRFSLRNTYN